MSEGRVAVMVMSEKAGGISGRLEVEKSQLKIALRVETGDGFRILVGYFQ